MSSRSTPASARRPPFQTRTSSSLSTPQRTSASSTGKKSSGPSLSLALSSPPISGSNGSSGSAGDNIHPLKYTWDVFFSHRSAGHKGSKKDEQKNVSGVQKEEWEEAVVKLGGFSSIESLHPFLAHLVPPSALPSSIHSSFSLFNPESSESTSPPTPINVISDYNIFRSSITPAWEDAANVGGGRWVLRLRKGVSDRVWEEVVYALVGERIGGDDERAGEKINGVVLSVRKDEDILSLWVAPSNRTERDVIRDSLRTILQPLLTSTSAANLQLDYKPHPVVGGTPNGANGEREKGGNSRLVDLSTTDSPSTRNNNGHRSYRHHNMSNNDDDLLSSSGTPRSRFDRGSRDSTPIGSGRISSASPLLSSATIPHQSNNPTTSTTSSSRGTGFSSYVSRNSTDPTSFGGERIRTSTNGSESPFFNRSRESSPATRSTVGGGGVGVIGGGLFGRTRSQRGEQRESSTSRGGVGAIGEDGVERSWGRF